MTASAPPEDADAKALHCRVCRFWYGAEDDEYGPCSLKHMRTEPRYVTYGAHRCDEGLTLEAGTGG